MRADGAFRLACRARRVKDGGVILRIERHVRQRPIGQQMPVAHLSDDCFKLGDLRMRDVFGLAADEHPLQRRTILQVLEQSPEPLMIDNGDLGAGIVEAVLQFRAGPPGIEQNRNAAGEQTTKESRRPFRQIAHGDGDAIAFLHARALQRFGDGKRGAREFVVAYPLIAIDYEGLVAVRSRQPKEIAHGRRRILPNARAHAANVALLHLEGRTAARQQRMGFCERHGRKFVGHALGFFYPPPLAGEVARESAPVRASIRPSRSKPAPSTALSGGPPPPHLVRGRMWIASSLSLLATMRGFDRSSSCSSAFSSPTATAVRKW